MTRRASTPAGSSRFTRSVNLEQDLHRTDALAGYVVTSAVRRALLRLCESANGKIFNRAITLTGPYGTGKSSFALFAAQLLAPDWWPNHEAAQRLLRSTDKDLETRTLGARGGSPKLLPVVVTGSRESLSAAIIRALI